MAAKRRKESKRRTQAPARHETIRGADLAAALLEAPRTSRELNQLRLLSCHSAHAPWLSLTVLRLQPTTQPVPRGARAEINSGARARRSDVNRVHNPAPHRRPGTAHGVISQPPRRH